MAPITSDYLYYDIFRDSNCTNEAICREFIDEIKDFVFDNEGAVLSTKGYSGVPIHGRSKVLRHPSNLWKIVDVLFKLTEKFSGLVFSVSTDADKENPFYVECEKNEVLPKWANSATVFNRAVFGHAGVLHCLQPEIAKQNPHDSPVEIIRKFARNTRNILITEAVQQQVRTARARRFGMQRLSVNMPEKVAYIARQRPDLLSHAVKEFGSIARDESLEEILDDADKVMVHVELSEREYKVVTAVADIDGPSDIVSHRLGIAMLAFDRKYSSCQNGELMPEDSQYQNMEDVFERDRFVALAAALAGKPLSIAHQYQTAKELVSDDHRQVCRNIFRDDVGSSTDQQDTACSGDDEDTLPADRNKSRKQVLKKKKERGELGKKRTLAAVLPLKNLPPDPPSDYTYELETPTTSAQLRNFERAVNGDDIYYKESSEERSLGEEEELEFFAVRSKATPTASSGAPLGNGLSNGLIAGGPRVLESDDGFDVSELLNAPPLATNDEFDDI